MKISKQQNLPSSVALVTGGTKGIGAATAIALAKAGADVALVGRKLSVEAKETRRQIEKLGGKCLLILADVAEPVQAARCVKETAKTLGPIDVLLHSAGGPVNGGLLESPSR
jgi:NAD(P)-dependent dehydrogenase (short-subunit alcohol dehydrogenase family)